MAQDEEQIDILHIGNLLRIDSAAHGEVTGRVIYRDGSMMRLLPQEASDRALEFPLINDGYGFAPALGVTEIEIIEEQTSDYYVDVLGVKPGETVEFFTVNGEQAAASGVVADVIKGDRKDNIVLTDGRTIRFRGVGPKEPIAVVRVVTARNRAATEASPEGALGEAEREAAAAETERQQDMFDLLTEILPTVAVEAVPTADRVFPDSMQREDLFQDLLGELTAKQKTNPRRIRFIEREVDVALALKNIVVKRDAAGRIAGIAVKPVITIADAVAASDAGLPAAIPIVTASRVLNLDDAQPAAYKASDVTPRDFPKSEHESATRAANYEKGTDRPSLDAYLYDLLGRDQHVLDGAVAGAGWKEDQDVIRTAGLGSHVAGLSRGLATPPDTISLEQVIADVTERSVRVIGSDRRFYRGTASDTVYAPSDPSVVSGYVMLPTKVALSLRPPKRSGDLPMALVYSASLQDDNLPTITEALRDLYAGPDEAGPLHAWTLEAGAAAEAPVAEWLKTMFKYAIHPLESLGPRTPQILSLLDTLGLANADVASPVADVVWQWVKKSQTTWRELLDERRKEIQAALDTEPPRTYQSVTQSESDPSPLWPALQADAALKELMEDIQRRNPSIADAPTLVTAALLSEAQGDAAPLAWATIAVLDGHAATVDPMNAAAALNASRSYILRRKALRDFALLSLRAEPEINTCPHVDRLEAIRNTGDALQRARLLREFVDEYQGGKHGDWMTCALCTKDAVCYHELMELEAFAQPARAEAILKQMLIRYGGERYQGKIVCRNCGQALQDMEYDDRPEFDDEGNVVAGFSVLTEEQMADDIGIPTYRKAVADLAPPPIAYATPAQEYLGQILQKLMDRGGIVATPATMLMIVQYADRYVSARAPSEKFVEDQRALAMRSASTKMAKSAGGGAALIPSIPTYAAIMDQFRVSALAAMSVIALQASETPVVVQNPFVHCKFSRGGWPLDETVDPKSIKIDTVCAASYVSCVLASIDRQEAPWMNMVWFADPKWEAKQRKALDTTLNALTAVLGLAKGPAVPFAGEIRTMLEKVRADTGAAVARALISIKDQLPVGFRPDPFPPRLGRPAMDRDPVPAILASPESTAAMLEPVGTALRQQSIAIIGELHAAATAAVAATVDKPANVSEFVCCSTTIANAQKSTLLGDPENAQLLKARNILRGSVPTAVNAGSHLWQQFDTPIPMPIEQTVEDSVLFKLFLKFCYTGPSGSVGKAHEFSVGNQCRQCGLALGKPVDLVDFAKEGSAILAAQLGPLKVEITKGAFDALSDAVRRRKLLTETPAGVRSPWQAGLEALVRVGAGSNGAAAPAAALDSVLAKIVEEGEGKSMDELERGLLWMPVAELKDTLLAEVGDAIGPLVPTVPGPAGRRAAEDAIAALSTFDKMTADPFLEGPRAVQEYWCATPEASGLGVRAGPVMAQRWFDIGPGHAQALQSLVEENYNWYGGGAVTEQMSTVLRRIGTSLGPLMRIWTRLVRPTPLGRTDGSWTVSEGQLVLRSLVLQVWRDALVPTSWMYRDIAVPADRQTTSASIAKWSVALMKHVKRQFIKYSKEEVRQVLQQRAELERTTIVQEFENLGDDDLRAAELMKKQQKRGRWAGGVNLTKYDAERFEFERSQRERMGIVETTVEPIQLAAPGFAPGGGGEDYGLGAADPNAAPEVYDMNQAAEGDDY